MEKRILIIDYDVDFTDPLKANLKETGKYKVHVENHGFRVFHAAKAFRPDLIRSAPSTAKENLTSNLQSRLGIPCRLNYYPPSCHPPYSTAS